MASDARQQIEARRYGRDYIERTIATVRNHREADNCWPQWANIFADEIEAVWAERDALAARLSGLQDTLAAAERLACESCGCRLSRDVRHGYIYEDAQPVGICQTCEPFRAAALALNADGPEGGS